MPSLDASVEAEHSPQKIMLFCSEVSLIYFNGIYLGINVHRIAAFWPNPIGCLCCQNKCSRDVANATMLVNADYLPPQVVSSQVNKLWMPMTEGEIAQGLGGMGGMGWEVGRTGRQWGRSDLGWTCTPLSRAPDAKTSPQDTVVGTATQGIRQDWTACL